MYRNMANMEYFNFIQQYKDYFATSEVKKLNQVLFIDIFFKDQAIF